MPKRFSRILARLSARMPHLSPLRRFQRDQKGATAVEFGMIALPFFGLMFAIIETAFVFFASQVLETAVVDSSRLIMTGQAQNFSQQQFKDAVCSRVSGLFDCANGIRVDVRNYSSFSGADVSKPVEDGKLTEDLAYSPGKAEDIVVVRIMYEWPVLVPWVNSGVEKLANGKRLLMATAAFRNEPY